MLAADAYKEYGGDGTGSFQDVAINTIHTFEKFNFVSQLWDAGDIAMFGTDKYGRAKSRTTDMGYAMLGAIPLWGMEEGGTETIAPRTIESFSGHSVNQAITRGFRTSDILQIIREGNPVLG